MGVLLDRLQYIPQDLLGRVVAEDVREFYVLAHPGDDLAVDRMDVPE
ncbi:hypothetical protein ACFR95_09800 [Halolamina salifodinae]